MKQTKSVKLLAAGAAGAVALVTAFAQETSTTTTTTAGTTGESTTSTSTLSGSGTITTYTPGSDYITFRTESSTTPVKYYYTKKTVLVDPEGRTVEWTALKPDMPVTYTYTKDGDRMVVTKGDAREAAVVLREERNGNYDNNDEAVIVATVLRDGAWRRVPSLHSYYKAPATAGVL